MSDFMHECSLCFIFSCCAHIPFFNSVPNDKILDWSKLKAFADNKINVTEKLKFVLGRVENIVGKGENVVYKHVLLFPQYFQRLLVQGR